MGFLILSPDTNLKSAIRLPSFEQVRDDKRAFDVWLATERSYLPVRIRYTEKDGTAFDSLVEAINVSPH